MDRKVSNQGTAYTRGKGNEETFALPKWFLEYHLRGRRNEKALALGLVLVLAMSVSALAASVDGSLKFEYDYEVNSDWQLTITPDSGIPKTELVLNVKDEGWAFNAEIRRILEGKDVMQLRQIKANLDEPQVALTIWANGKETEDKKDPLEFNKSSKLQEGRDPKFRLEAGVFGVSAVVDYQNGKATVPKTVEVDEEVCILADVVFDAENNVESYKVVADEVETDKLYGFLDTTVQGNKVGLAYYSDMAPGCRADRCAFGRWASKVLPQSSVPE